jgi:hypothetical protein
MLVRILQSVGLRWRPETLIRASVPDSRAAIFPSTPTCKREEEGWGKLVASEELRNEVCFAIRFI